MAYAYYPRVGYRYGREWGLIQDDELFATGPPLGGAAAPL